MTASEDRGVKVWQSEVTPWSQQVCGEDASGGLPRRPKVSAMRRVRHPALDSSRSAARMGEIRSGIVFAQGAVAAAKGDRIAAAQRR